MVAAAKILACYRLDQLVWTPGRAISGKLLLKFYSNLEAIAFRSGALACYGLSAAAALATLLVATAAGGGTIMHDAIAVAAAGRPYHKRSQQDAFLDFLKEVKPLLNF